MADEKTAMVVDYFSWNWHNRWLLLQQLITEGELGIVLCLRVISWLSEHIKALDEEAEREADKVRQMVVCLDDEFI